MCPRKGLASTLVQTVCQSRESRRASESGRLVPACHIIGQRMCGSLASECRSRNGATNKTRTCKTTPVSTISVRGPFVARWCGSVEQICTRRQCQQKCQQQCRASLIELSLLVALSQPRIKLRRVAGQCTASLVKARSGQVDARAPLVQAVASPSPSMGWPWSGSRSVSTRAGLSPPH